MALAMDRAALLGKGDSFEPLGLLNIQGISTIDINAVPDERTTGAMLAQLIRANADTDNLGWGFNGYAWEAFYNVVQEASGLYIYRDQMDKKKLSGHDYAVSNQIPAASAAGHASNIILGDWSEYMIGRQGNMETEMFREGTIVDEDGTVISAVDRDFTILRIIDEHDFAVRHPESFVVGRNVKTA